MRITDALYGEHGSLYMLMNAIEARLAGADLAMLQTSAALFETAILAHAHFENDPFFAALDRVMPGGGPVTAMRAEHEEIEGELAKVATSAESDEIRHLFQVVSVKIVVGVELYIVAANPGIRHNGRAAAGFQCGGVVFIVVAAASERMAAGKLVPHFVGDIIYIERVAYRSAAA